MKKGKGSKTKKEHKPKVHKTHHTHEIHHEHTHDRSSEKILIENFVSLQKVLTNLSLETARLNDKISSLLNLFESSAKALAEKEYSSEKDKKDFKEILKKLDSLNDQNKVLAKGITFLHENGSDTPQTVPVMQNNPRPMQIQVPRPQMQQPGRPMPNAPQRLPINEMDKDKNEVINLGEYQKSISSMEE